ncbi:MAG: class I SAM-dependent methyltransferase [Elusimicrobia bacterium]|nr:class I SAM-dependent methyltransferase [Elusimicrobiota bacterium]
MAHFFKHSSYKNLDQDSAQSAILQAQIFKTKKPLRDFHECVYKDMVRRREEIAAGVEGLEIEIGSGGGFFKEIRPQAITTDVKPVPGLDRVLDARSFPFDNESTAAIYAFACLHHIPEIRRFFKEALRILKPGGVIVAVEPYWGLTAKILFTHFHEEPFNAKAKTWEFPSTGPMSGANQALSYLLLKRDREQFQQEFPDFQLRFHRPFSFIEYLCTGGNWRPQLAPTAFFPVLRWIDNVALAPLMPVLAIHHAFVLQRRRS